MRLITAITILCFFFSLCAVAAPLHSQDVDLGKLKKKEDERKKKAKKSKAVITNKTIEEMAKGKDKKRRPSSVKLGGSSKDGKKGSAAGAQRPWPVLAPAGGDGEPGDRTKSGNNKAYWQGLKKKLLSERDRAVATLKSLEEERNQLAFKYPAEDMLTKRLKMIEQLKELENKTIPEQRKKVAAAEQALADLATQARKAGAPPGWLRLRDRDRPPEKPKPKKQDKTKNKGG